MGDTFGMLYGTLSPERKLKCAIYNNMLSVFIDLIEGPDGPKLVNSFLYTESSRTPLHICTLEKNKEMVIILLKNGANPLKEDQFGLSALDMAFQYSNLNCLILLLEASPTILNKYWDIKTIYGEEILKIIIIGSTTFLHYKEHFQKSFKLLSKHSKTKLHQLICLVNNTLPMGLAIHRTTSPFVMWHLKWRREVRTLRHCSRVAVRNTFKFNAYYCSKRLSLPVMLQKYLVDFDNCIEQVANDVKENLKFTYDFQSLIEK